MIVSHDDPLKFKEVLKLEKFLEHYKEQARVTFIEAVLENYKNGERRIPDLWSSTWKPLSVRWNILYTDETGSLEDLIFSFLHTSAFKNFALNENVYFYRYVNVIRRILGNTDTYNILNSIKDKDEILSGNLKEYVSYHQKLAEIKQINDQRIKESSSN
jgi:hypothetical protein